MSYPAQKLRVGILNCYRNAAHAQYVIEAVRHLGHIPVCVYVTRYSMKETLDWVHQSNIRHWIGTGSDYNVCDHDAPCYDESILRMRNKKFLLICYSMQSFLAHVCKCQITKLPSYVQEMQTIGGVQLWRNHHFGFYKTDVFSKKYSIQNVQTFADAIVMSATCGNVWMTQYHPERSKQGTFIVLQTFLQQ